VALRIVTSRSLNGLIDTIPNRLAPEFSARFVDPSTFVSRGSLTVPYLASRKR